MWAYATIYRGFIVKMFKNDVLSVALKRGPENKIDISQVIRTRRYKCFIADLMCGDMGEPWPALVDPNF